MISFWYLNQTCISAFYLVYDQYNFFIFNILNIFFKVNVNQLILKEMRTDLKKKMKRRKKRLRRRKKAMWTKKRKIKLRQDERKENLIFGKHSEIRASRMWYHCFFQIRPIFSHYMGLYYSQLGREKNEFLIISFWISLNWIQF